MGRKTKENCKKQDKAKKSLPRFKGRLTGGGEQKKSKIQTDTTSSTVLSQPNKQTKEKHPGKKRDAEKKKRQSEGGSR